MALQSTGSDAPDTAAETTAMVIRKVVTVPLSQRAAFKLFTEGIGTWWPTLTHSVAGSAAVAGMDDRVGGEIYEQTDAGRVTWGTITAWDAPDAFSATWHPGYGSELATRTGTFRIWVKVFTTKMDNLDKDEVDRHYAIEDVPWVQFFDKAIALHGAFWHREFGHIHSHGCVNLAPLDARWLFAFTAPHLPAGWIAVLPTKIEQGAVVRVR